MSLAVIIPVLNGENYIERAIQSCVIQPEIAEIIIVNDGSSDGTFEICTHYQNQFPTKIKIYSQLNMGSGYSRNFGIQQAKSNYITFLDHDDYYLEKAFETIRDELNLNNIDGFYLPVKNQIAPGLVDRFPSLKDEVLVFEKIGIHARKYLSIKDYLNGTTGYLAIHGFIFNRKKILTYGISFEQSILGEEHNFLIHALLKLNVEYRPDKPKVIRHLHGNNLTLNTKDIPNQRFNLLKKWVLDAPNQKIGKKDLRVLFYYLLKWTPASLNIKSYYIRQTYRMIWGMGFLVKHPKIFLRMF